jgi:hypothetical protein
LEYAAGLFCRCRASHTHLGDGTVAEMLVDKPDITAFVVFPELPGLMPGLRLSREVSFVMEWFFHLCGDVESRLQSRAAQSR